MNPVETISIHADLTKNKVYVKSLESNNLKIIIENWNFLTNTGKPLYLTDKNFFAGGELWFSPNEQLGQGDGFKVTVTKENTILKEEFFQIRSRHNGLIKKQVVAIGTFRGMGDVLTATPAIKKFSEGFGQKIILITTIPDAFINNPYVEEIIKTTEENYYHAVRSFQTPENVEKYDVYETHRTPLHVNWALIDVKQFCATDLGFNLKQHEADMAFYPDPYQKIDKLPENFICVNPSITSSYRSWGRENWQKFISLIENHIPVVAIGKDSFWDASVDKSFYKINITNGLNLINDPCQNSLSQAHHIISKSKTLVTMNNGLYCLALSTYNHITELAAPLDSYFLRIRKGILNYNLDFVSGSCNEICNANLKYSVLVTGKNKILKQGDCFLGISPINDKGVTDYQCHPSVEKVYDSVLKHLKTNKYIV